MIELSRSERFIKIATSMFRDLRDNRLGHEQSQAKAIAPHLVKVERDVANLLEHVLEASMPSVIHAYKDRIRAA